MYQVNRFSNNIKSYLENIRRCLICCNKNYQRTVRFSIHFVETGNLLATHYNSLMLIFNLDVHFQYIF